jgi:phage gp29-like protein
VGLIDTFRQILRLEAAADTPALPGPREDADILTREVARASLVSTRSILAGHPADDLTPEKLAILLRNAEAGDPQSYLELAEQMEERDLHYLGVLGTRKRQVAQLPITVEAATDSPDHVAHADLVRRFIDREALEAEMFDLLDAVGKGYSFTEIVWGTSGGVWLPEKLKWRDPRWFEWDRETGETPLLKGGLGDEGGARLVPLPPHKFIVHRHPAKSGLPVRSGLARPVAWSWMFKAYALKDWVAFAEVYGFPFRLGKYPPGASEEDIGKLLQAVHGMGVDAAAVIPQSMEITLVDGKTNGSADLYERLVQYLDRQVSKAVLGQTATTDADTGGLGSGKEHGEVRADIERADAKLLAGTLFEQLVVPIVAFNFGPQGSYPKLKIGREEAVDIQGMTAALGALVPLGLEVEMSVVRDRLGFPDPAPGAVVLRSPVASPAPPPENRPIQGLGGPPAPITPPAPEGGLLVASYPRYSLSGLGKVPAEPRRLLIAAAERLVAAEQDAVDEAAAAIAAADSQSLLGAIVRPLLSALSDGASFEEAAAILDAAAAGTSDEALGAALEAAMLRARMAGEAGQ